MPKRVLLPVGLVAVAIAIVLAVTLRPYGGNPSALFHLDENMQAAHPVPPGFVVLTVPGYDGMEYYQLARTIDEIGDTTKWETLRGTSPASYAYQRILLPILAHDLSVIGVPLPISFIAINIGALLLATAAIARRARKNGWLYGLALGLSPAAMIALHFDLAEPLTLVMLTVFLLNYLQSKRIGWMDSFLLMGMVLSREVNILFVALFLVWSLGHKAWKDAAWTLPAIVVFLLWHGVLFMIFQNFPFLTSAAKHALPFQSLLEVFAGVQGYNRLTASSMVYALCFFLPGIVWLLARFFRGDRSFFPIASLCFLGLMSLMSWDIWGSITSIGRVITPVYPLVLVYASRTDTWPARLIAAGCLLCGLAIAAGLALTIHPFVLS